MVSQVCAGVQHRSHCTFAALVDYRIPGLLPALGSSMANSGNRFGGDENFGVDIFKIQGGNREGPRQLRTCAVVKKFPARSQYDDIEGALEFDLDLFSLGGTVFGGDEGDVKDGVLDRDDKHLFRQTGQPQGQQRGNDEQRKNFTER